MATPNTQSTARKGDSAKNGSEASKANETATTATTGATSASGDSEATTGATSEQTSGETTTKKHAGALPTLPIAVVYREQSGRHVATVLHPKGGEYKVSAKGVGGAKGQLEDEGFMLGSLYQDGPEWAQKRIPEGVTVLGFASLRSFPLPPQT